MSRGILKVYIPSLPFMAAKMSVQGLILSSSPYMRSAKARFPLDDNDDLPKNSLKLNLTLTFDCGLFKVHTKFFFFKSTIVMTM